VADLDTRDILLASHARDMVAGLLVAHAADLRARAVGNQAVHGPDGRRAQLSSAALAEELSAGYEQASTGVMTQVLGLLRGAAGQHTPPETKETKPMLVTLTRPVIKRCPFRPETDAGTLTIVLPASMTPELHNLDIAIDALSADGPRSHEDYTAAVVALLPECARVATTWTTGSWAIEVTNADDAETPPADPSICPDHALAYVYDRTEEGEDHDRCPQLGCPRGRWIH
jgi:hypothetical protein